MLCPVKADGMIVLGWLRGMAMDAQGYPHGYGCIHLDQAAIASQKAWAVATFRCRAAWGSAAVWCFFLLLRMVNDQKRMAVDHD